MNLEFLKTHILKYMLKLRKIDAFGKKIEINFNREVSHKTLFGAFITIICSIIVCIVVIQFILEIFEKSNPSVL